MAEYLVTYECVKDSYDWGKKGAITTIRFKENSPKKFRDAAPGNWVVEKVDV